MTLLLATVLSLVPGASADAPDNWEFSLDGYYRVRSYSFFDLYEGQVGAGKYVTHKLRLQPGFNFENRAKAYLMFDGLDGVLWGDNAMLASTALFAGDPSLTNLEGQEIDSIALKRAWMEFSVALGLIRVGRQGSHWGMGLLANEGNGFDDNFGENKTGATYDRFIFATRPISVYQTLAKKKGREIPLVVAVGIDRLVEDPLDQYYGTSCDPDDPDDGCDSDEDHGYSEQRDEELRQETWWIDQRDDVWETVYVLRYAGEGVTLPGGTVGDITAGLYAVNRRQEETASNVLITDAYAKVEIRTLYAEGEILHIGGDSRAITLPGAYDPSGQVEDPLYKDVDIWGYVGRGGYQSNKATAYLEVGSASGDAQTADQSFTGRPIHSDYNVGLLMYEEILARVTAEKWSENARGLWSNGGVYNSRYVMPTLKYRPLPGWEGILGVLVAWPDVPDGSRILCAEGDVKDVGRFHGLGLNTEPLECAQYTATAKTLGWEVDAAVKYKFHQHINFSLEGGYAHITDRIPLKTSGLAYETDDEGHEYGNFMTIQSRVAYEF